MTHANIPAGFRFAAMAAGLKKSQKPDLALIVSDQPATCAGVFTRNKVVAAPVVLTRDRLADGSCRAVLVNSGNANACTGEKGMADATRCGDLVAEQLEIPAEMVAVSSTGVIGQQLPMEKFEAAIPTLCTMLGEADGEAVARAMMTTDQFPKHSTFQADVDGVGYSLLGLAKGAGMIHPDMATMLGFILTDAAIDRGTLQEMLQRVTGTTFNAITVDRDTSTNDMVLVLANGAAGNKKISAGSPEAAVFEQGLHKVMLDLAKMIVRDGEGATKLVEVKIRGARGTADARLAAESVATSNLVKTAFFGADANWGRIIAAVGYSGADVDQGLVGISFDDVQVVEHGLWIGAEQEAMATQVLQAPEFTVTVDLGLGQGEFSYYTSDLTYDYVKINADYRT
ncbi:MAG: ornithine acetyltransferase [Desulfuromonas sp.]|nr:MAG: ornithine acetyltransferase [Desulfuromonas sp.]